MTSWGAVSVATILLAAQAHDPARAQGRRACLSDPEMRDAMQGQTTIPPLRALAEALRDGGGETVAIQLCRGGEAPLVYDISILRRDGHLVHVLVDAKTGGALPGRKQP